MNILVLCLSEGKGGLEFYISKMAKNINRVEHKLFFCVKPGSHLDGILNNEPGKIFYLTKTLTYFPLLSALRLAKIIDELSIDCLFLNWGADLPLAAMAKAMSKKKPKLIYSRHMKLTRPKHDFYHRWIYARVDLLLTISEQLRAEVLKYLPLGESQVKNCYLGVAQVPVQQNDCVKIMQDFGLSNQGFHVALFGRIEHGKGQHVLVDAINILNQRGVSILAAIIGHVMDRSYYNSLRETIRLNGLEQNIRLIGFVDYPMKVMPCFDVIVLTTYEETFGLVLVEAMRCGVAVIGTRAGGVQEIIDDGITGLMFEPGNAEELANCLQIMYENDTQRKQMAEAGKRKADKNFDETTHFSQLTQLLMNL